MKRREQNSNEVQCTRQKHLESREISVGHSQLLFKTCQNCASLKPSLRPNSEKKKKDSETKRNSFIVLKYTPVAEGRA